MNKTLHEKILKIVLSGLFAAVIFVLTAFVPIPLGHGYANAGDAFVVLSGMMLGPWAGLAAAGVGSAMADLYLGYSVYAPATFVIKGLMAVCACLISRALKTRKSLMIKSAFVYAVCESIMVLGYFLFEGVLYGFVPSALNIPANAMQGLAGLVIGIILVKLFEKTKMF